MAGRKRRKFDMPPEKLSVLISRIKARIIQLDTNAWQVSTKAGLGRSYISELASAEKNVNPSLGALWAIANALNCDVAYLIGEQTVPQRRLLTGPAGEIPVIGFAEAGSFRTMMNFDQDDAPRSIAAAYSQHHPTARHFALDIRGDSMNAAKPHPITDGSIALCVDFISAELQIETRRIYAVRRTQDDGQTWECTVKRARVFKDRYEFVPESSNSNHQPVVIPRVTDEKSRDIVRQRIEVVGLVYETVYEYKEQ